MRANNVDVDGLRRRLVMAAATAEERYWNEYENANISLSVHQSLSQVVDPLPNAVLYREAVAVTEALESAPMAPAVCYGPPNFDKEASEEEREAKAKEDTLYSESKPVLDALDRAIEAAEADAEAAAAEAAAEVDFEAEEAAEEAEDARALASLETQVWLELDLLLRTLAKLRAPETRRECLHSCWDCCRRRQREAGPTRSLTSRTWLHSFARDTTVQRRRARWTPSSATRIMSQSITSASRQGDVLSG